MRLYLTKAEANILLDALETQENAPGLQLVHTGLKRRIRACLEQQKPFPKKTVKNPPDES